MIIQISDSGQLCLSVGRGSGNGRIAGPIFYDGALNGDSNNDMLNETIIPFVQHAFYIEIFSLKKSEKFDHKQLSRI